MSEADDRDFGRRAVARHFAPKAAFNCLSILEPAPVSMRRSISEMRSRFVAIAIPLNVHPGLFGRPADPSIGSPVGSILDFRPTRLQLIPDERLVIFPPRGGELE